MNLITAEELRIKQKDYLNNINDEELSCIQKRLLEVSKTERSCIEVSHISETNIYKLKEAGYIVIYQEVDRGEFAYIIKW